MTESTPPTPPATPTPPSDTPIGDEAQEAAQQTVAPDPVQDAAPVEQAPAQPPINDEDGTNEDDEAEDDEGDEAQEIKRALARETQDGKGDEDPGESDWVSYATEGVEVEDDK